MSSIDLRNAAAVLRELAEGADDGPWYYREEVAELPGATDGFTYRRHSVYTVDQWDKGNTPYVGEFNHDKTAIYAATMSPPVALALADWLDAEADHADSDAEKVKREYGLSVIEGYVGGWFHDHPALAVASAILKARA